MAKFYSKWNHADLGEDVSGSSGIGDITVWKNKPLYSVHYDYYWNGAKFWWKLNDYTITSEDKLDDSSYFTLNYSLEGTYSPSSLNFGESGNQKVAANVTINPIFPWETTISDLDGGTTTRLTRTDSISLSSYHKGWITWGVIGDQESFAINTKITLYDNYFAAHINSWSLNREQNQFTVNMSASLPKLLNASGTTGDISTSGSDEVNCNSSNQYVFTTTSSSSWRPESYIPTPPSESDDKVDTKLETIKFYNDEIQVFPSQLGSITSFNRNGKVLSWNAVQFASTYSIYVDNNATPVATVSETSWTIPDDLYYDQKHSYSIEVNDNIVARYYTKSASGKKTPNASKSRFPILRRTRFSVYKGVNKATHANWTDVGLIAKPTVTPRKLKLNSWTFSVAHTVELGEARLYYKNGSNGTLNAITNATVTLDKLKVNTKYDLYFYVSSTVGGKEYFSDAELVQITPTAYPKPSITGLTKTGINSYSAAFSSTTKPDQYDVFLNGVIYRGNATSPITISGWKANTTNKIKIRCVYKEDASYNSEVEVSYGANYTPLLGTPTLTKKDIKFNGVEQGFGDAGSKEIIDNVVTQVELNWTNVEYASGYVLYDKYKVWNNDIEGWEEGERIYPTQESDADTEYMQTTKYTIYMDNVMGYHDYTVKAIASIDESYNSNISNKISLNQNFPLEAPKVYIDDPNSTTVRVEPVANADFYSIQLVPDGNSTHTLFRSFTIKDKEYTLNYYDMVKDLTESENFTVSVFARSYNAFYFHPSEDSGVKGRCTVIKLNTPTALDFNADLSTVTWTGDPKTHEFEIEIKALEGHWVKHPLTGAIHGEVGKTSYAYSFDNLASSLYSLYILSHRDDSKTNHQPVYLDSELSQTINFGTINTPKDFTRIVNQFSWSNVGADRYVFYEWIYKEDNTGHYDLTRDSSGKPVFVYNENITGNYEPTSLTTVDGGGLSLYLGKVSGDEYRPTEGKHFYSVQGAATISGLSYESKLSDPLEVDIVYLKTLVAKYTYEGESYIDWAPADGIFDQNVIYDTRVNNINEKDMDSNTSYAMDKDEAGTYYFKVRSVSTIDEFLFQNSEFSNEVIYNVFKLNRPNISFIRQPDNVYTFSWEAIPNATEYYIRINKDGEDVYEGTQENTSINYLPDIGMYAITVIAKNSEMFKQPNYIDSEMSNMVKFGVLAAPEISIEENIISWKENPLVDYYEIYNYGKKYSETDKNIFELDVSVPYSYSISVVACSTEESITPSRNSNSIQYVITQLEAPQNVKLSKNILTWDLTINADSYRIFIDDTLTAISSSNRIDLTRILDEMAGVVRIYVIAFSNKINLLDSEESNYVLKRIEKQKKYNIVINGVNYDEIQLPFAINETLDETLDKAELTLAYIDRKDPFERLTPAAVIIYEGHQSSKSYKMIIESDDVAEIQIGTEIKYKHKLQLVERTMILQNEIIPDFTVSTSIGDSLNMKGAVLTPTIGNNTIPKRNMFDDSSIIATGTYNNYTIDFDGPLGWVLDKIGLPDSITIPLGFVWFFGLGDCVKGNMRKNYLVGDELPLPVPTSRLCCFHFSIQELFLEYISDVSLGFLTDLIKAIYRAVKGEAPWWEVLVYLFGGTLVQEFYESMKTDNDWPYPARNYYIRPHNDSYGKTSDEKLIFKCGDQFNLSNSSYTLTEEGSYDLVMEIPAVNFQKLHNEGKIGFDAEWFEGAGEEILPQNVNFMRDANGNLTTFRIVWPAINVVKNIESVEFVSIANVLEKISALTGNKYKIDPAILAITRDKQCPDLTFAGGKYIYDVLEEIGREFNGIPRLLEDDFITFDILNEYTAADRNLNGWQDTSVLSSYAQEIDKVTSGFVSRLSNLVPDDDTTIYPAPGMWVHPRGETTTTALVGVENMAIAVDKPIYKIKQVLVKNALKEHPDLEIDITEYVYQDAVYNALNDNNYGKGLALQWSQGERFIRGLGQMPEADKLYSIMGWKSDKYVIQNIVWYYMKMNMSFNGPEDEAYQVMKKPADMLFRVEYQGYTDTTAYIENPDRRNNKYNMYTVFNQEANTITDGRFGNGALTQLKRHGGNEIQKKYICYSVATVPYLGSSINVGNVVYYLDDVQYVFHNKYIEANCTFTKNYNKVNPRVAVNSEYRQYELRADNNVDRVINFNKYCYIGTKDEGHTKVNFENWQTSIKNSLNGNTTNKPDTYYFNCYQNDNLDKLNFLSYDDKGTLIHKSVNGIAKPVSYSKIGSSIMFTAKMDDAFTAGQSISSRDLSGYIGYKEELDAKMVQNYVRYVNDNSFDQTPYMRVTIGSIPNSIKTTAMDSYPDVKWLDQPKISMSNPLFSEFFKVYKDQREALGFNYQLHFISNREDLFIHKGFTKYLFKNPNQPERGIKPIAVAFSDNIRNKDVLDLRFTELGEVSISGTNQLSLNLKNNIVSTNNYTGIAIIWPDTKEILLEIAKPIKKDESIKLEPIYFNFFNKIKN